MCNYNINEFISLLQNINLITYFFLNEGHLGVNGEAFLLFDKELVKIIK